MNKLQEKILEIFVVVENICTKHNLRYFAIGGTCLGAVRHGGFIPWDDDLDIAMPREDYERFKQIAKNELPSNLKIMDDIETANYTCHFMKVHNIDTTFIEKGFIEFPSRYTGVYVDIMPLDGIPKSDAEKKKYFSKLTNLYRLNYYRMFKPNFKKVENVTDLVKMMGRVILYPVLNVFPHNYFKKKYVEIQQSYSYEDTDELGYTWSAIKEITFSKKAFDEYVELPFEDTIMRCPRDYDMFLKSLFGDYMRLPPEEAQKPHHEYEVLDLDKSYSDYLYLAKK